MSEITGIDSAYTEAKEKPLQNMVISANLVAEIIEENKALLEQIAALENPWVSVDDRLPDEKGHYLVKVSIAENVHRICLYIGHWVYNTSTITSVTHWTPIRPLPKDIT